MTTTDRCLTCKFFEQTNPEQGICRRFPPTGHLAKAFDYATKKEANQMVSAFVTARVTDWCGEYRLGIIEARSMPTGVASQ